MSYTMSEWFFQFLLYRLCLVVSQRFFALIPCAGVGARAGSALPKQYRMIAGHALLHYTLSAFDACLELSQTLLVIAPQDTHFDARRFSGLRFIVRRCGGATRQASVLNGLEALIEQGATEQDWVLVHDAARPGITPTLIRTLLEAMRDEPVGGILALPLADTLKRAQPSLALSDTDALNSPRIISTEPRDDLWLAQTPQMFRLGLLRTALQRAQHAAQEVSDEASALEYLGYKPRLVMGSLRNFKVTYPNDFETLEAMLGHKKK